MRVNWIGTDGKKIASEIMSNAEAVMLAADLAAFMVPVALPPTPAPPAPVLTGKVADGKIVLSWIGEAAFWEVWLNDKWAAELLSGTRSWVSPAALLHTVSARVVAYDAAGKHANSNTITLSPAGTPEQPAPAGTLVLDEQWQTLDLTRWGPYSTPGNHSQYPGLRKPSAIEVKDGTLVLTASYDPVAKIITTGAMSHRFDWAYGDVEVRVRTENDPTGQMSGVVLRWPFNSMVEGDGEYDFYETTRASDNLLRAFYHYAGTQNLQEHFRHSTALRSDWHTVRMSARPDSIKLFCDDQHVWTVTNPDVLKNLARKGHVCIQLDVFGRDGYVPLPAPVRMYVDCVKIWTT